MHPQSDSEIMVTSPPSLSEADSTASSNSGIASLPPEILSHIFIIGSRKLEAVVHETYEIVKVDDDTDDDKDFATLCSHVCQYWRAVAINASQLWCSLDFSGDPSEERCKVWIERSKDAPLSINISHTVDDRGEPEEQEAQIFRELSRAHTILDLILPHAHRWKAFDLVTDSYEVLWLWESELVPLQIAPILEHIGIFCHADLAAVHGTHLQPPSPLVLFPGGTPKIRSVNLWGVHFNWELATFFAGLEILHLAWHEEDDRLTTEQFVQTLRRSPKLGTLFLEGSAPTPGDWPQERIQLPKLRSLGLKYIGIGDAISVIDHLDFPNLGTLVLDLEVGDVKDFIHATCQPNKSRFGSIQSLMLVSFNCSAAHGRLFLGTLHNVKSLRLDFNFLPRHFGEALAFHSPWLCPKLEMLKLSGLNPKLVKALIQARQMSPMPVRQLYLDEEYCTSDYFQWFKDNVPFVETFEISDVESDDDDEGIDEGGESEEEDEGSEAMG